MRPSAFACWVTSPDLFWSNDPRRRGVRWGMADKPASGPEAHGLPFLLTNTPGHHARLMFGPFFCLYAKDLNDADLAAVPMVNGFLDNFTKGLVHITLS